MYYVGSFEREVTLSSTVDKTYIGDHTIKMKAHVGSLGNQSPFQHVLRDHLGSVDTLMDAKTGSVLQHRGYDVFGRPRDIAAGNNLLTSWQGVTKGYTDHEHLNEQELIHMNGRIYDFNIGRFLSVDPFLQFPENSQSANPYSYILNNPMSGVDPTGYISEELDEDISGKTFEKLEKDESGNLYVTADGDTYKLTSVSNGEKNFSISFDGNGGGTAQVGKTTGTVSLHKGNSSTNVNQNQDNSGFGADDAASIGVGFTPAGIAADVYTAVTGEDFFTGEDVSGLWRWAGLIPFASEARKLGNVAEAVGDAATQTIRQSNHVSNVIRAPKEIPGISGLNRVKSKTPIQGGGGLRERWKDKKGKIYEWDSRHGELEMYNKSGKHLGSFDPQTGKQLGDAIKSRNIKKFL
ncbi:hypothetical protein GCM10009347_30490 [Shewanella algicola]|uniref:Colicin E3/pyocin S6 family cytotoxin n=1 Tax=Shewanella algicola TaxID=640633 RepID=A0A9X1ZH17_9GAMM|nr:colicin E3/pyocin S6 family cytotoxin [Shewanella algicola]MCL1106708.1 colicin E3/pyocin S6 family cytotoxin [Shewanella algicola]GGP62244.1 hypothetical protein GCM10009347_30490 [Shewanella algicola]